MIFFRLFSFFSLCFLIFSINLMAGSEFNEAPKYKVPHTSMTPGWIDPNSPKELDRFELQNKLVKVENQQIMLEGIQEPHNKKIVTPLTTTTNKISSSRPEKLKIHKEKKSKKLKSQKKSQKEQKEKTSNIHEANSESDDSRPQTMIIKYNDENDHKVFEKLTLQEERTLPEKKLPSRKKTKTTKALSSNVSSNTNVFDDLLGSQKKWFTLPPRLDTWELLLLLSAGNEEEKEITNEVYLYNRKVYLYDRNLACNCKSLLQGKTVEDLVPFLQLNKFRNEPALLTLKKYLIINDQNVKRKFSLNELSEIENAITTLQKRIDELNLSNAGAILIAKEKREISTLAYYDSLLAEYQMTEGKYPVDNVVLSLTFYFQK